LCFSEVEELSSLATIRLAFGHFQKTHPQSFLSLIRQMRVQYNFVKALPWNKPSVKNLVLENFRPAPDDSASTSELFQKCLGSLAKLSISTISATTTPTFNHPLFVRDFWEFTIPDHFLSPAQSSLTSLTLHSDCLVPVENCRIECPHLVFISVSQLVFLFRAGDEEDFISRQRNLTRIELLACGVLNVTPVVRWSHIWKRIGENLKSLEYLEVDFTQNPDVYMGYVNRSEGMVDIFQQDDASLQALQADVRSRRVSRID
jgi:hypothetical protein